MTPNPDLLFLPAPMPAERAEFFFGETKTP